MGGDVRRPGVATRGGGPREPLVSVARSSTGARRCAFVGPGRVAPVTSSSGERPRPGPPTASRDAPGERAGVRPRRGFGARARPRSRAARLVGAVLVARVVGGVREVGPRASGGWWRGSMGLMSAVAVGVGRRVGGRADAASAGQRRSWSGRARADRAGSVRTLWWGACSSPAWPPDRLRRTSARISPFGASRGGDDGRRRCPVVGVSR